MTQEKDQINSAVKAMPLEKEADKQEPYYQKSNFLVLISLDQIKGEFNRLIDQSASWLSKSFWQDMPNVIWKTGGFFLLMTFFLFVLLLFLLFGFRKFCRNRQDSTFLSQRPFLNKAFGLFQHSLTLIAFMIFLYILAQSRFTGSLAPIVRLLTDILWVLLITRWFLDFVSLHESEENTISVQLFPHLRSPIIWIRSFAIFHLVIARVLGETSVILLLGRMLFEIGFLFWYFRFSGHYRDSIRRVNFQLSTRLSFFKGFFIFLGYIILGGGLALELTGYGRLAVYWFTSWVQTAVVILWGGLFFSILREWYFNSQKVSKIEDETDQVSGNPFRWLFIWISWLAWVGTFLVAIIVAWGGKHALVLNFLKALNYPLKVGNMQFSLLGFVYGFLIILLTHATVRIWRLLFQKKVLERTDIEIGLQESIATIAVYVFWIFGIMLALHAIGLNTTTLAVGIGALGIGLGFGLQNIFNNFISGIILLFERPIQVGDAIEINGIWADVKKINVRATVVQTWDNASLIIPNSEFVSSKVTNWSFKDLRLRRNIVVGVVYGSDVELVRNTLLEIAENTARVLKDPQPDVLFSDFGDSALIFRLRVWTYVNQMLTVESNIRFEIDRLFRERHITIAFPQRDIHIRSVVDTSKLEFKSGDTNS